MIGGRHTDVDLSQAHEKCLEYQCAAGFRSVALSGLLGGIAALTFTRQDESTQTPHTFSAPAFSSRAQ
jgi:hypothetical protein